METSVRFVLDSVKGQLLCGDEKLLINGVSTDSRKIAPGNLFIALKGDNFDGNCFANTALENGAAGVVISDVEKANIKYENRVVIKVEDSIQALQNLAGSYRRQFKIPIIAITGSVGKTSTKEILAAFLSTKYKTLKTPGNFNNDIGLPLSLLQLDSSYQAAVLEMGMRARGEIDRLAGILKPDYAIITNIAPVHLETLGSLENIAAAKCEVLGHLSAAGLALLNGDNEILLNQARKYKVPIYTFGYSKRCDFQILKTAASAEGLVVHARLLEDERVFRFPLPSTPMAANIVSAAGLAYLLGVDLEGSDTLLHNLRLAEKRLDIKELADGGIVINDTYNANPLSMQAALEVLKNIARGRRKVAVLGDMLELGDFEYKGHFEVGRKAAEDGIDLLITVGKRSQAIAQGAETAGMSSDKIYSFSNREAALEFLQANLKKNEALLFKASRSMQLDILLNKWLDDR